MMSMLSDPLSKCHQAQESKQRPDEAPSPGEEVRAHTAVEVKVRWQQGRLPTHALTHAHIHQVCLQSSEQL